MKKRQRFSMQQKSHGGETDAFRGVEVIPEDGVAHGEHMDTQLMGATGARRQAQPCCPRLARKHLPMGLGGATPFEVHALPGAPFPIRGKREINVAALAMHIARHDGNVTFAQMTPLELKSEMTVRPGIAGHDKKT